MTQVLAALFRNCQGSGKWGGRKTAWHGAGQGAIREPYACCFGGAWEARPVGTALCDPTSLNSCRGHWGQTSEKTLPGVSDYRHPELLPPGLPSWPCPSAQQGPGTTGAFRNIGEMSLSSLKTYHSSLRVKCLRGPALPHLGPSPLPPPPASATCWASLISTRQALLLRA